MENKTRDTSKHLTPDEANKLFPLVTFEGKVKIGNCAVIGSYASIENYASIGSNAVIGNYASIGSNAVIGNYALIKSRAIIETCAKIGKNRKNVKNNLTLRGLNQWGITVHDCDEGIIFVVGCWNEHRGGTADELREAVITKHGDSKQGKIYFKTIDFLESVTESWGE